jgi:hypothetical protein
MTPQHVMPYQTTGLPAYVPQPFVAYGQTVGHAAPNPLATAAFLVGIPAVFGLLGALGYALLSKSKPSGGAYAGAAVAGIAGTWIGGLLGAAAIIDAGYQDMATDIRNSNIVIYGVGPASGVAAGALATYAVRRWGKKGR